MVGHVESDSYRAPDSTFEETAPLNLRRSRPSARSTQNLVPTSSSARSVFDPASESVFNVCDSIDRYRFPSDAARNTVHTHPYRYQHDPVSTSTLSSSRVNSNVFLPLQTEDDSFQSADSSEYSELYSPLDTTNRFHIPPRPPQHDPSISTPHRLLARSSQEFNQRSPFRSVSLPQKLGTAHMFQGKLRVDQTQQTQQSSSQQSGSQQSGSQQQNSQQQNSQQRLDNQNTGLRTGPRLSNYGNNSTDAIPSSFRKQRVSSDQNPIKAIGRSKTEPHINAILSDETEGLAINVASIEEESLEDYDDLCAQAEMLCMVTGPRGGSAVQRALQTPDILRRIFEELDMQTVIPQEIVQERRKPASLVHAQLLYGKTPEAIAAWQSQIPATTESISAGLFNCLLVNKLWHDVAVHVLEGCIHFSSNEHWTHFARRGAQTLSRKPKALVLHKLNQATQVELEMLDDRMLGSQLEWLEFYTCPRISPTKALLGDQLKKIALPGCNRVNDQTLFDIAHRCPQLEHLDVRACDHVSDTGVKVIARYCPNLKLINVGRTVGGERITYKAIKHLARLTNITTLGLAGCDIDDRAIWELALNRGPRLERLSLNNCRYLTDAGLPRVLGYMPNLTVLEIRGCLHIKNVRPIALFKLYNERRGKYSLIEGCEIMERCIQVSISRIRQEMNTRRLTDLTNWVNRPTDN